MTFLGCSPFSAVKSIFCFCSTSKSFTFPAGGLGSGSGSGSGSGPGGGFGSSSRGMLSLEVSDWINCSASFCSFCRWHTEAKDLRGHGCHGNVVSRARTKGRACSNVQMLMSTGMLANNRDWPGGGTSGWEQIIDVNVGGQQRATLDHMAAPTRLNLPSFLVHSHARLGRISCFDFCLRAM